MSEPVPPPAAAPAWFVDALADEPEHHVVEVDGVRVAYRAWGEPGLPVVVLVHGGAAHAGWWDHVGPFLTTGHRVAALDLSGHGDSDHRPRYDFATWAATAMTSAVRRMSSEARAWLDKNPTLPPHKVHPSREAVEARFKTLPSDDATLDYVRAHIAAGSVREVQDGWTWKFDPRIFFSARMEPEALVAAPGPIALVRGERGMATADITESVATMLGGDVPVTLVPDSGHHIMLDQPLALIAVLQAYLGEWSRP
ncbi:MAG: alpha/beta fold hydrolase [Actinomycetales bacterium]|nr:MAG: alpha/beta fold hydrolase [Actinomycetales bacterium]